MMGANGRALSELPGPQNGKNDLGGRMVATMRVGEQRKRCRKSSHLPQFDTYVLVASI